MTHLLAPKPETRSCMISSASRRCDRNENSHASTRFDSHNEQRDTFAYLLIYSIYHRLLVATLSNSTTTCVLCSHLLIDYHPSQQTSDIDRRYSSLVHFYFSGLVTVKKLSRSIVVATASSLHQSCFHIIYFLRASLEDSHLSV
jgi:hypothetical protein